MSYAKKSKKTASKPKKSSYRYRASAPKRSVTANKSMVSLGQGFPKKLMFTHKYNDITTATSTLGVPLVQNWSCNGLFDPYLTGVGHQPMYFDQLTALYDHYCVIASKATVIISGTGATVVPCQAGIFINDDTTTTPNTLNSLGEQTAGRFKDLNNQSGPIKFSIKWSAKKQFGGTVLSNTELQGTSLANPTESAAFSVYLGALDQASTQTYVVQVFIEYIAIWKELKDLASS